MFERSYKLKYLELLSPCSTLLLLKIRQIKLLNSFVFCIKSISNGVLDKSRFLITYATWPLMDTALLGATTLLWHYSSLLLRDFAKSAMRALLRTGTPSDIDIIQTPNC